MSHIQKAYTENGVNFIWNDSTKVSIPLSENSPDILSQISTESTALFALEELWEEELLIQTGHNRWFAPYELYDQFGRDDPNLLKSLGLPVPEKLKINAIATTHVGDQNFRIRIEAHHPVHGLLRDGDYERKGSVFIIDSETIIPLSIEQRELFDAAQGEDVQWEDINERMVYLARVKEAAINADAKIDKYINSEDYQFVDDAKLDIAEESSDEIILIPAVENIEEFTPEGSKILLRDKPPTVLTKAERGLKRKRMVFDPGFRNKLRKLPPGGKVTGSDVPRLLTNPEQIIPEDFDLSLFSERVKGITTKVYNSRPYIHVRRSTGGWFEGVPGIELEDWSPSETETQEAGGSQGLSPESYQELVKRAKESGDEYTKFGDDWIRVDPEVGEKFENTLESLPQQEDGIIKIPDGSILEIYSNLDLLEFADLTSIEKEENLLPEDLPQEQIPDKFNGSLLPYQLSGYRWLTRLDKHHIGGLLADDMGLGKTIQVITHMLRLKEKGEKGPHLVVVPKSLVDNWIGEISSFSNNTLKTFHYYRGSLIVSQDSFNAYDVILVTYDTLRRDQTRLATINWNLVVCDEAQYAKNPTAQRTSAVKALKAKHRAALTGTPVENGLVEFWCIMDFVQPGLLGSWSDFRTNFEKPIINGSEEEKEEKVNQLLSEIKGYYLRRLKSDVLKDLPPKNAIYREVPLSDEQMDIYRFIAHQGKAGGKGAALGAIQQLIILSAHPFAIKDFSQDKSVLPENICPKLQETINILSEIQPTGEKAIIFTDYKAVQRILQDTIRRQLGIWPDIINGELTKNRQMVIDIFSEKQGFNVVILGHQVAGVGLNITAANHVIHYTRPWNPAKENQATDRTHRIGQTKPVNIYYPITKDKQFVTVEERLKEVIESKEDLARDVLRPSAEMKISPEDLLNCLQDI
ncbi:MAG: DEAD/DEAH box helicase [Deltaproteobacteria bacterium]|nr:DEAD/DEAH box helicase [Deltaproteobacteria bacterium]